MGDNLSDTPTIFPVLDLWRNRLDSSTPDYSWRALRHGPVDHESWADIVATTLNEDLLQTFD